MAFDLWAPYTVFSFALITTLFTKFGCLVCSLIPPTMCFLWMFFCSTLHGFVPHSPVICSLWNFLVLISLNPPLCLFPSFLWISYPLLVLWTAFCPSLVPHALFTPYPPPLLISPSLHLFSVPSLFLSPIMTWFSHTLVCSSYFCCAVFLSSHYMWLTLTLIIWLSILILFYLDGWCLISPSQSPGEA